MSSMSQNVAAQTAPASISKPKNKLFGLSREELKIVTGGTGIIVTQPVTDPLPVFTVPATPILATPVGTTNETSTGLPIVSP